MRRVDKVLDTMRRVADDPTAYIEQWKQRTGGKVIGIFPMNFPAEVAHAGGALPVVVQENRDPISLGNGLLSEFNCGYTRNIADQSATGRLDCFDALFMADHCIQLIGAADVVRELLPDRRFVFEQLISSMNDPWTNEQAALSMRTLVNEIESFTGRTTSDQDLLDSIKVFNRGRRLMRQVYESRRNGNASLTSTEHQIMIKSSMIMEREEHNELLADLVDALGDQPRDERVRVHLSGHFCHAPKPELLDLVEAAGGLVVDDDLYHGARHISMDAAETGSPIDSLVGQYLQRNVAIPCPTRAQSDVDWDDYMLRAVERSGAEVVVSLMAKYCEPHMLYLPEVRKALDAEHIPHLLLETEHEGMPLETMRTRLEATFEQVRRARTRVPA